jgi:stage II sporulation protein GA (sporulation sigma-E factor processing peptidase)
MRIIPFHSIGKKSGLLQAFQAETLEVESGGVWKSVEKPWVAVCDECVSVDGEYEVILHPGMLINEKKKEDN